MPVSLRVPKGVTTRQPGLHAMTESERQLISEEAVEGNGQRHITDSGSAVSVSLIQLADALKYLPQGWIERAVKFIAFGVEGGGLRIGFLDFNLFDGDAADFGGAGEFTGTDQASRAAPYAEPSWVSRVATSCAKISAKS